MEADESFQQQYEALQGRVAELEARERQLLAYISFLKAERDSVADEANNALILSSRTEPSLFPELSFRSVVSRFSCRFDPSRSNTSALTISDYSAAR